MKTSVALRNELNTFTDRTPANLVAPTASRDGAAIACSNVSVSHNGVVIPVTCRGKPIDRWTVAAWGSHRFFHPSLNTSWDELVTHARSNYPKRDLLKRVPPLRRPKLAG